MFFVYKTKKLFYKRWKGKLDTIVFLHGWGCDHTTMSCIYSPLIDVGYDIITLDFFGFGKSAEDENFTIYDYANSVEQLLVSLNVKKTHLVCHSFGGRVGILLASRFNIVDKLVLIDSAGLKSKRKFSYYYKVFIYKLKKKLHIHSEAGSKDYQALSIPMRKVFVNVVNTHLDKELNSIKNETLIIWGDSDNETPLYMAKKLENSIKNSGLIILNGGHFVFLDNKYFVNRILQSFFEVTE